MESLKTFCIKDKHKRLQFIDSTQVPSMHALFIALLIAVIIPPIKQSLNKSIDRVINY